MWKKGSLVACGVLVCCGGSSKRNGEGTGAAGGACSACEAGAGSGGRGDLTGAAGSAAPAGSSGTATDGGTAGSELVAGRGGSAAGESGADTGGTDTSGASGTSGGTGTSGTSGDQGGAAGESGTRDCKPSAVRCDSWREVCSEDGRWELTDFSCTIQIAASAEYGVACALKSSGEIRCWGEDYLVEPLLSSAPTGAFQKIYVADEWTGSARACALNQAGDLSCWGVNAPFTVAGPVLGAALGQYGLCTIGEDGPIRCQDHVGLSSDPLEDPGPFRSIEINNNQLFGLRADGVVVAPFESLAFLPGEYVDVSSNGNAACAVSVEGRVACVGGPPTPQAPSGIEFVDVELEYFGRACGRDREGRVHCWNGSETLPPFEAPAGEFKQLAAPLDAMCGLRVDGSTICWGEGVPVPPEGV